MMSWIAWRSLDAYPKRRGARLRSVLALCCLALIGAGPSLADKASDEADLKAWKKSAATAYDGMMRKLGCWGNTWQTGCSFSTALDYMRLRWELAETKKQKQDLAKQSSSLIKTGLDRWQFQQGTMCWYDDYSWWGIASAKAFDPSYSEVFGDDLDTFQGQAVLIWQAVNGGYFHALVETIGKSCSSDIEALEAQSKVRAGAPNAWPPSSENHFYLATPGRGTWAKPLIEGGAWQHDMYVVGWPPTAECGAFKPANPLAPKVTLGPFQDTVINGLYLNFASRLGLAGQQKPKPAVLKDAFDDVQYPARGRDFKFDTPMAAAKDEFDFLAKWSADAAPVPAPAGASSDWWDSYRLFWNYANTWSESPDYRVLVRERVGIYDSYLEGAPYNEVQNYDPVRSWAGDQGLLLGGLVEYDRLQPGTEDVERMILGILRGAFDTMVFDQVLQPYYPPFYPNRDFFSSSGDDYSSGAGVFWRHLMSAFQNNDSVQQAILKDPSYLEIVRASANVAMQQVEKLGQEDPMILTPWTRPDSTDAWEDATWVTCGGAAGTCNGQGDSDRGTLFNWFNPLATLTAAITIFEQVVDSE